MQSRVYFAHLGDDMEWPSGIFYGGKEMGVQELLNEMELGCDAPPWDEPGGLIGPLWAERMDHVL